MYQVEGGTGDLLFLVDDSSSLVEALVDTTHGIDGGSDFSQEDGLLESGLGGELAGVVETSTGGDDLSSTSVDGIGMENAIHDVDTDVSHVLFAHGSFLCGPLPGAFHGILKFVHVLDTTGLLSEDVSSGVIGTESPDLEGLILIPVEFL